MLSSIADRRAIQEHISEYLDMMKDGQEIIVTDGREEIGRFLPRGKVVTLIGERLKGILSKEIDAAKAKDEALRKKYEITD